MKIIENNFFDLAELKNIIEKQDFFNDCKEPEKKKHNIISFASNHDATKNNIYWIAKSIFNNSIQDDFYANKNEFIQETMKYINDTCVITYYTIYDEKEVKNT